MSQLQFNNSEGGMPIMTKTSFKNGLLANVPSINARSAVVLLNSSTKVLLCVTPNTSRGEIIRGKYDTQVTVDLTPTEINIDFEVSSLEEEYPVMVKMSLLARVTDPEYIVGRDISHLNEHVMHALIPHVESITKTYSLTEWVPTCQTKQPLDKAILHRFSGEDERGGITVQGVSYEVRPILVSLPEKSQKHIQPLVEAAVARTLSFPVSAKEGADEIDIRLRYSLQIINPELIVARGFDNFLRYVDDTLIAYAEGVSATYSLIEWVPGSSTKPPLGQALMDLFSDEANTYGQELDGISYKVLSVTAKLRDTARDSIQTLQRAAIDDAIAKREHERTVQGVKFTAEEWKTKREEAKSIMAPDQITAIYMQVLDNSLEPADALLRFHRDQQVVAKTILDGIELLKKARVGDDVIADFVKSQVSSNPSLGSLLESSPSDLKKLEKGNEPPEYPSNPESDVSEPDNTGEVI